MVKIVALVISLGAVVAVGCGSGTLGGPDGGGDPNSAACSSLTACGCMAAGSRCTARTEACYCPSECNPSIACICGGGQFLACEDAAIIHPTAPACLAQAMRVQQQCAAQPFVDNVDELCRTQTDPCVTSCLANLGSCSEIDCRFCPVCDCAPPDRANAFAACIEGCGPLR